MPRVKTTKSAIVSFSGLGHKGHAVGRTDEGLVVFAKGAVPGDVAQVTLTKKRKGAVFAFVKNIIQPSPYRQAAFCKHFGHCGGCSWQHLQYLEQIKHKEQIVIDAITRIAKSADTEFEPIEPSSNSQFFRNKLEFTFSANRWLTPNEVNANSVIDRRALGFHRPDRFDKVVDIETCYLQNDLSNRIRNELKAYALANDLGFYDPKAHLGFLRNLIIRTNQQGQAMCILSTGQHRPDQVQAIVKHLTQKFHELVSFYHVYNPKNNDAWHDLDFEHLYGTTYLQESLDHVHFLIGPKSFFQTNTAQTKRLYKIVEQYAALQPSETVYDLYCGVGSIGIYLAHKASQIVGIDAVEEAIADARKNAAFNRLENAFFYAGDVGEAFDEELISRHGHPDVLILDPPRAGLHQTAIRLIMQGQASRIIYVSCNPATQARDVSLLAEKYVLRKIKPVDMFPHTNHVESVGLLLRKL